MGGKFIYEGRLDDLVGGWADSYTVMVPGKGSEQDFGLYDGEFNLPIVNTKQSVKGLLFTRCELLFSYKTGKEIEMIDRQPDVEKTVVVGARPCDVRGIELIGPVFCSGDELDDQAYSVRRDNMVIVTIACDKPGAGCFCTSTGGDPHDKVGDVFITRTADKYLIEPLTDKGADLVGDGLQSATDEDVAAADEAGQAARTYMQNQVCLDGVKEQLDGKFEHEYWSKLHEICLGCGVCTYLCPTCHCFDVIDEKRRGETGRYRVWDSCQFPLFTLHASGHNPRPSGKERMRQRVMHKFNYYPHNYGSIACVGCGRCVEFCPVHLDIRQVLTDIGGMSS